MGVTLAVAALGPLTAVVGRLTQALVALRVAMNAISAHPLIALATALAAVGVGLMKKLEKRGIGLTSWLSAIGRAFESAGNFIKDSFVADLKLTKKIMGEVAAFMLEATADIIDGFAGFAGLFDWLPGLGDNIKGLQGDANAAADGLRNMADSITGAGSAATATTGHASSLSNVLRGALHRCRRQRRGRAHRGGRQDRRVRQHHARRRRQSARARQRRRQPDRLRQQDPEDARDRHQHPRRRQLEEQSRRRRPRRAPHP